MVEPGGNDGSLRGLQGVSKVPLGVLSIRRIGRDAMRSPDGLPEAAAGQFGAVAMIGDARAVSLAPGDWIVLGPSATLSALAQRNSPAFLCSDLSHGRLVLRLEAGLAAHALAAFCPLDRARDLAPGRAAASLFADIDATFLAEPEGQIVMIADCSYGAYVGHLLRSVRKD